MAMTLTMTMTVGSGRARGRGIVSEKSIAHFSEKYEFCTLCIFGP